MLLLYISYCIRLCFRRKAGCGKHVFVSYPGIVPCSGNTKSQAGWSVINKSVIQTKVCSVVGSHHRYTY